MTYNGQVSAYDAAYVLRDVVGAISAFPVETALVVGPHVIHPVFVAPIKAAPGAVIADSRDISWDVVGSGFAMSVDDLSGVIAADMSIELPSASPVTLVSNDMMEYSQDGNILSVSFIRMSDSPTLFTIQPESPWSTTPILRSADVNEGAIGFADPATMLASFSLMQNQPNPFNPSTTIGFVVPEAGEVSLTVYGLSGQVVRTVIAGHFAAGSHSVVWDGMDAAGRQVASGTYIYRLSTPTDQITRRMVLIR